MLIPLFLGSLLLLASSHKATPPPARPDPCAVEPSLAQVLKTSYPSWEIVSARDLDPYYRAMFARRHGQRCPGLVKGKYWGKDAGEGFALFLKKSGPTPKPSDTQSRLLVARRRGPSWELFELEEPSSGGVSGTVVWTDPPGSYEDMGDGRVLKARHEVVAFVGYESWARIYVWVRNRFEWVQVSD